MKWTFNKENWPIMLLVMLFVAGRMVWGYLDHIDLLITSEGARVEMIRHSFWGDLYTLQMRDGTYRKAGNLHWYFLPALANLALMFRRKRHKVGSDYQ